MRRYLLLLPAVLCLLAGCATNTQFVYKPGPPGKGVAKLPAKIAVLAFGNETENFTKRGTVLDPKNLTFNVSRAGVGGSLDAITPELFAKSFADDLSASGAFSSVRFAFGPKDIAGEEFFVDGVMERAYLAGAWMNPNDFAFRFRVVSRRDGAVVHEGRVSKAWITGDIYRSCGLSAQCMVDRMKDDLNKAFRDMFAEGRGRIVEALRSSAGGRPEGSEKGARPSGAESVEDTIRNIMEGK